MGNYNRKVNEMVQNFIGFAKSQYGSIANKTFVVKVQFLATSFIFGARQKFKLFIMNRYM